MSSAAAIDETETARAAVAGPPGPGYKPFRVTVDRFSRMIAAGVFGEGEPVILWKGAPVWKVQEGSDHADASVALANLLIRATPTAFHGRVGQPMAVGDYTRTVPDLAILRGTSRDFRGRAPGAESVALVVEVSDRSLAVDSEIVLESYASRSIPVYWIVNLPKRRVEVHRDPTGPIEWPTYRHRQHYLSGDSVPVVLDGTEVGRVAVDDILP